MSTTAKCPICGAPTARRWRPFCSKRCADIDLNRWLSGRYAIPAVEDDDEEEKPPRDEAGGEDDADGRRH